MYVTPDQITGYSKAGFETFLTIARSNFAAYEKLAALNFNATKSAFEESRDVNGIDQVAEAVPLTQPADESGDQAVAQAVSAAHLLT